MARTFQRLETFSLLSVRENVLAGAEFRSRWADDDASTEVVAHELITKLGLQDVADERVDALPTGRARLVEVARALSSRPRLLLLDEPSSGLNESETEELAVVLRELTADGLAVLHGRARHEPGDGHLLDHPRPRLRPDHRRRRSRGDPERSPGPGGLPRRREGRRGGTGREGDVDPGPCRRERDRRAGAALPLGRGPARRLRRLRRRHRRGLRRSTPGEVFALLGPERGRQDHRAAGHQRTAHPDQRSMSRCAAARSSGPTPTRSPGPACA